MGRKRTAAAVLLIAAGLATSVLGFFALVAPGLFGFRVTDGPLVGTAYLLAATVELSGGGYAYRGRYLYAVVLTTLPTALSVITLPFGVLAVLLLFLSRGEFRRPNWPFLQRLHAAINRVAELVDRVVEF